MLMRFSRLIVALVGFVFAGCQRDSGTPVLSWAGEGVAIQASLTKIRRSNSGVLVHGNLHAVGTSGRLIAVDLECIGIDGGDTSSKKIYVDGLIDVIPSGYRANSQGVVEVGVYWSMQG